MRETEPQRICEASHPIKEKRSNYRIGGKDGIKQKIKCSALIGLKPKRAVGKALTSSLDREVDLEHCFL